MNKSNSKYSNEIKICKDNKIARKIFELSVRYLNIRACDIFCLGRVSVFAGIYCCFIKK